MGFFNFFSKEKKETLDKGLEKTKQGLFDKLKRAVAGRSKIDDDFLDNLEEVFITSDVGVETTLKIIDRLQKRAARDKYVSTSELNTLLRDEITEMLAENNNADTPDFFRSVRQKAICNNGCGRKRGWKNDYYRKTCIPVQEGGQQSRFGSRRHIPCGSH